MSDPNYNRDQLINSNFEAIRQLQARVEQIEKHRLMQAEQRIAELEAKLKGNTNGN